MGLRSSRKRLEMRRPLVVAAFVLAVITPERLFACSCSGFSGLVATARQAADVIEARVISHHSAPDGTWTESIVVQVVRSFKGRLSGQVRLYGSGRGDCTVPAGRFAVGQAFLFVLPGEFGHPLQGKPGYGLYGHCQAVSASLRDGRVEGILWSTRKPARPRDEAMPLARFIRAISEPNESKDQRP